MCWRTLTAFTTVLYTLSYKLQTFVLLSTYTVFIPLWSSLFLFSAGAYDFPRDHRSRHSVGGNDLGLAVSVPRARCVFCSCHSEQCVLRAHSEPGVCKQKANRG
jgi:hypothetical protein